MFTGLPVFFERVNDAQTVVKMHAKRPTFKPPTCGSNPSVCGDLEAAFTSPKAHRRTQTGRQKINSLSSYILECLTGRLRCWRQLAGLSPLCPPTSAMSRRTRENSPLVSIHLHYPGLFMGEPFHQREHAIACQVLKLSSHQ